ncbi:unnamed protein product [Angiostrongylus costaricensis]|uniref:Uncharacterized protein n=1 Tax=Angiostrongylus costaricensis TaxID=334426 RepID=A0A158PH26_ANGCS|nr:unnamed protein product [Angiostrongylus costaricensis]
MADSVYMEGWLIRSRERSMHFPPFKVDSTSTSALLVIDSHLQLADSSCSTTSRFGGFQWIFSLYFTKELSPQKKTPLYFVSESEEKSRRQHPRWRNFRHDIAQKNVPPRTMDIKSSHLQRNRRTGFFKDYLSQMAFAPPHSIINEAKDNDSSGETIKMHSITRYANSQCSSDDRLRTPMFQPPVVDRSNKPAKLRLYDYEEGKMSDEMTIHGYNK